MIITIDGYAGSGKSTAARRLADALGFALLNTGAMYRAVRLLLAPRGIDIGADVRAQRRLDELRDRRLPADPDAVRRQIKARDRQDEARAIDPLRKAADAVEIDTSHLSADEVLRAMTEVVRRCRSTG